MKKGFKRRNRHFSIGIFPAILFLSATHTASAQVPPAAQAAVPVPSELNIQILEGEGATIDVHHRNGKDPVVRIEDQNHNPIGRAVVVFTLPTEGATGEFATGNKSLTVTTDNLGLATGKGLRINQVPGKLQIHVTVSYKGLNARTNIVQFVEGPAIHGTQGITHKGKGKWIAIAVLVGAAGAGGAVAAMSSKNGSTAGPPGGTPPPPPTVNPIGITAGAGTIAPPH
jgi:hypothetical protein